MGRPPCCDKSNVKRGLWTDEEDAKLLAHVSKHGTGNWTLVPKKAGLNRCGKSCRLRWTNYLRPDLNHDDFTPQEEDHIINLHQVVGSRWSLIAKQLPGRTDNDVKNYWNTKLRKKLSNMGIDPLTHKPFSQIFLEFGNISACRHALSEPDPSSVLTGLIQNDINNPPNPTPFQQPRYFFGEATISSSPCSSTSSSLVVADFESNYSPQQSRAPAPASLEWSDFLVHEPCQVREREDEFRGRESDVRSAVLGGWTSDDRLENPSVNSFVDDILYRDSELRSAFPEFLDESLEYY